MSDPSRSARLTSAEERASMFAEALTAERSAHQQTREALRKVSDVLALIDAAPEPPTQTMEEK